MWEGPVSSRPLDIGVFGARGIPSTYGGYETFLTTLLPALAARGHLVTAYCRAGCVDGDDSYRGVRRVVVPGVETKRLSTLTHGARASRLARRAGHDVVLAVNPANALFCARSRLSGQGVLLNTDGQEWRRGKWGFLGRAWFKTSARAAGWCASGLIADGKAMADIYADEFSAPSTVIPYCFPSSDFTPDGSVLAAHGVSRRSYFVVAARLNPENNVDTVAQRYVDSDLELPLLVCGEANYDSPVARRLQELARVDDRVRLIGHVHARLEFLSLLACARAYVHGHSVGGTNPSLIEAMSVGSLVVALDTPFNREALGGAGRYFPGGMGFVGDVAQELQAVSALGEAAVEALRAGARQRVQDEFGVAAVVSAYEEVLTAAVDHPGRGISVPTQWSSGPTVGEPVPTVAV